MFDRMAFGKLLGIFLMALVVSSWAMAKPTSVTESGHFGVDGFHNYQPGLTPISDLETYFAWEAEQMAEAGLTWNRTLSPAGGQFSWNRIEETQGIYDWEVADALVKACQEKDIQILALVHPYTPWDQPDKNDREYGKPNDMAAFKDFLEAMVERYDGDGVNDMLGLEPGYAIKHWEIDNEPEGGKYGGSGAGTQQYQDYYETLKAAYEAIKGADPEAKVLNAGASPLYDPATGRFQDPVATFWENVITNLGGENYIDILNIHTTIPEPPPPLKDFIDYWKRFNKTMWVTEGGTYSGAVEKDGTTWPYQSEEYQASYWVKYSAYGFAHDVTKVFWANFWHGPHTPDWFQNTAMINSDKSTKLIYTTQQVMASKIDNFSEVEELAEGQYRFTVDGKPVYVLWGSGAPPGEITGLVTVTDIYGNAQVMDASSLTLSDNPVFVERGVPTSTPTPTGTSTPTPTPSESCSELLVNGDFESGIAAPWVESSNHAATLIGTLRPHNGTYSAFLGDANNADDQIYQTVTLPAGATSATLTYWWSLATWETELTPRDFFTATLRDSSGGLLATLSTADNTGDPMTWHQATHDLSAYAGQTVQVHFWVTTDGSNRSDFSVDDVSLDVCGGSTATLTPTPTATPTPTSTYTPTATPTATPTSTPCYVGMEEIQYVSSLWHQTAAAPYDYNGDEFITVEDIMCWVKHLGGPCP